MRPYHYWKNDLKKFQALNGIRTHDLCVTGAMLYQLSYQSHMRAVVCEFGPICSVDVILGCSEPEIFSGHFSSSVMAAFASFIISFNCYCWTSTTMDSNYFVQYSLIYLFYLISLRDY